jgi:hypothetical protein
MELSDILETTDDLTRPRWVECPEAPGFAVLLRLPDIPGLRSLAQQAVFESVKEAQAAAEKTGAASTEIDPGVVGVKWSDYAVVDWRGLTGKVLRYFAQGAAGLKIKAADDTDIALNRQVLELLLRRSARFYNFIDTAWKDLEAKSLEAQESSEKNSGSAPDTTLTPPPGSVPGASRKKKNSGSRRPATPVSGRSGPPKTT